MGKINDNPLFKDVLVLLFIINVVLLLLIVIFIIRKGKYSWHKVLCVYFFSIPIIDIPEVTFNTLFSYYQIRPHFFSNLDKDLELGLIFADGLILPLTAVLFCYFATRIQNHWGLTFIFTLIHYILEKIYLSLGYLQYVKWNIWISMTIFLIGFRILAYYAKRLLQYDPPIPYSIRIGAAIYAINAWIGATIEGPLIGLYQWNIHLFKTVGANERFIDLVIGLTFAVLSGLIFPKIQFRNRITTYIVFAVIATVFSYYSYFNGWLIYRHWNHFYTALRWFVLFAVITGYDRLETVYEKRWGHKVSTTMR